MSCVDYNATEVLPDDSIIVNGMTSCAQQSSELRCDPVGWMQDDNRWLYGTSFLPRATGKPMALNETCSTGHMLSNF